MRIILLLIDPKTFYFDLFPLEYSRDVYVSEVMASSVTSRVPLTYDRLCDWRGTEISMTVRLSEACEEDDVIVAVPSGRSSMDWARLRARQILADHHFMTPLGLSTIPPYDDLIPRRRVNVTPPPTRPNRLPIRMIPVRRFRVAGRPAWRHMRKPFVAFAIIACVLLGAHLYCSAPLRPGSVLRPGRRMNKSGILSSFPVIDKTALEMNKHGTLILYGHDGQVQWRMHGGRCRSAGCETCVLVKEDGRLVIGGKPVATVITKRGAPLTPWPFQREPKLRVIQV